MKIMRFFNLTNLLDAATLTASSSSTSFPLANLQQIWKTKHHRTTNHESEWIKADLGADKSITAWAVAYHNLTAAAHVHLQMTLDSVGDDWTPGTLSVDEILPIYSGYLVFVWATPVTARWVRWTIEDPTNPDGIIKTGRPYVGTWWAPSRNFNNAYVKTPKSVSEQFESIGGQTSVVKRTLRTELSYVFEDISEADRVLFDAHYAAVEQAYPYFLLQDADQLATRFYYVKNISDWAQGHVAMDSFFNININVREAM